MSTKRWFGMNDLERKYGKMSVGMFIRTFREAEEQSQSEYALKLGLSRANLCDIEKGRKLVSPDRAARLARRIGVPEMVLVQIAIQDSLREAKLKYVVSLRVA